MLNILTFLGLFLEIFIIYLTNLFNTITNNMKKKLSFRGIVVMLMLLTSVIFGQTEKEKLQITSRYNMDDISKMQRQFDSKSQNAKKEALEAARQNNWPVVIKKNGAYVELQRLASDGTPIYYTTFNVDAAESTRTNHLNIGGSLGLNLDGQNMTAHVWDGGLARASHQEYDGPGGNNRFSIGDNSTTLNYHAAHVTGTIIASGVQPQAKGMAPRAEAVGYDWNSDIPEATNAAANGMLVSNHSYGFATRNPNTGQPWLPANYFGGYITESRDWDNLMFNAPYYLMVVAAGNDGNDNSANSSPTNGNSSYDKLTGHSTSKNNMVVANAQDANIDSNGNLISVSINSSSSEGPTDDFRIKPDITGNGTQVYSTYQNSNTAYNSLTGTSMASPNVAGSLLLLQQHANSLNGSYMRAATLKGLALHTADDAGPTGPDAVYGWGLMNAKRAAETLSNNGDETQVSELTLASGQTYQITVDSDGVSPLMASISWTDRAGTANSITNNTTPVLVNDLDLRVSKGGTTSTPWRLTGITTNGKGDNNVDPFERVDVANASGAYTITVSHKGSLTGGSQNYSLIITGLSSTPVVCNATTPSNVSIDAFADTTASISWDAVPGASYRFRYRASGGTWNTMSLADTSVNLSGLSPETTYEVQVRSECPDNSNSSYSSIQSFTTTEIQLNYCSSASTNINDEYISRVQLNTIDNSSGAQFYSNFTNISTSLTQGQAYTITVTPTWTGTVYAEGYSVWIDYNKDGDFSDAGEQVWTQAATTSAPVSGSFTIPNSTIEGNTRMRVTMQYNAIPSACGSFTYGEVEDYTVSLLSVTDTEAPVIALNGASVISFEQGGTYTEQGATATDNVDGDISSAIVIGGDAVNANVVGSYIVTYNVSDAAGNAAAQVTRTVNVTPETVAPVITLIGDSVIDLETGDSYTEQGATASDNFDGDISSSIVIGGDAVNTGAAGSYIVTYDVSDAAGNAAAQVSRTVNVTDPAPPSGCAGVVSTPYNEGFENTLGAWTQSSADDLDWTVDANGTPSNNTGPGSASQGSYYVYVEASGNGTGYPNKRAILTSPCFDLGGTSAPTFEFDYHMYGAANMGTIDVEVSTDNGTSWLSLWNESGNKGNQWNSASIDLSSYAGSSIQLRFNRLVGNTWRADIALDNISLTEDNGGGGIGCSTLDLNTSYFSFSNQDNGDSQLQNGNTELVLSNNAWKYMNLNYTVTANTVIQFDFGSTIEGEIHGIGFETDNSLSSNLVFKVHGTQNWGITDFDNYPSNDQWVTYSIDVGSYYTGASDRLLFLADHDAGPGNGNSFFRNIVIFEDANANGICDDSEFIVQNISAEEMLPIQGNTSTEGIDVVLYPNPVTGNFLNVKTDGDFDKPLYKITNMLGQVVEQGKLTSQPIDVSRLQGGVYLIQVSDDTQSINKRFIVK